MRATAGRLMQLAGLIVLPLGLVYGLARNELRTEVALLAAGATLFLAGRMLAGRTR